MGRRGGAVGAAVAGCVGWVGATEEGEAAASEDIAGKVVRILAQCDVWVTGSRTVAGMAKRSHVYPMGKAALMTAEELLALNLPNKRTELVRGHLVVREPGSYYHGRVAARVLLELGSFLREHPLGELFAAETGFTLFRGPDTVRAPDVAYIRNERLLPPDTRGFAELAPDLAVEVLSPDETRRQLREKIEDWLASGVQLVWIIDPLRKSGRVHRADGTTRELGVADAFDGEALLPGFVMRLAAVMSS
jgi:Uma2 family endonuclease